MTLFRIISETRISYLLKNADAELTVLKKLCNVPLYVGDIVKYKQNHLTLQTRKNLVTKSSNRTIKDDHQIKKEQVLASNVDQILILIALDQNFSLAKLERFYLVFSQENIALNIILTKKDLVPTYQSILDQINQLYPQINVSAISTQDTNSIIQVKKHLQPHHTVLLLGASGAGKSTLINHLLGKKTVKTNQTRSDGKGRHTTTSSLLLDCSELKIQLIDTPGFKGIDKVKELDLSLLFKQILDTAKLCHFSNCQHISEPKCAVKHSLERGELSEKLWERYCYYHAKIM
ncbi:ribosome small subunit-dependent GTPase A [Streptococcus sp. S784/96/1]|uniref:ribosome small subunit-dependent GTPase A n=1 Tax=Streptococcus sp. S784/96/1 TaxID=2653499 RepID=UPI001386BEA0|nr:ribosome small subunit-dependent GTPase A [Streptococcus sp. S784/96/1]